MMDKNVDVDVPKRQTFGKHVTRSPKRAPQRLEQGIQYVLFNVCNIYKSFSTTYFLFKQLTALGSQGD